MNRGQVGRDLARAALAIAAILGFIVVPFLYVAAPGGIEPMFYEPPWQETALAAIGFVGILIGSIWIVRIDRTDPEPDQRAWRYRERGRRVVSRSTHESYPPAKTRGQRGRNLARAELAGAAFLGFVLAPFLYLAAPGEIAHPMFGTPDWQKTALAGIGFAGILLGFLWMVRIYRADPEPDQRAWRYRERD